MRPFLLSLAVLTTLGTTVPAFASDDPSCGNAPREQWMSKDAITEKATGMGYKVHRVKIENGCYEIKAFDKNGNRAEIYANPVTGEFLNSKMDD